MNWRHFIAAKVNCELVFLLCRAGCSVKMAMATGLSASPSVVTTQEDALAVMEELTTHIKVGAGGHGYWLLNAACMVRP